MHVLLGFFTIGVVAVVIWRVLSRQEASDPDFERRLQADERRARSNREAAARGDQTPPPSPPA